MYLNTLKTFFTSKVIISKLTVYNHDYSIYTINSKTASGFHSLIKLNRYNRALFTVDASNTTDAVLNHIALVNMASSEEFIEWGYEPVHKYVPIEIANSINGDGLHPADDSLISPFTKALLKKTNMNASQEELDWESKIKGLVAASVAIGLSYISYSFLLS
jgi:hypothetical protein